MGKRLQRKHGSSAAFDKGLRRVLSAVWMVALPFGGPSVRAQETEGFDTGVVLGEEDLAERAEIARNTFRRITPGNEPLVQDVGTWPALWEAFGANWATAAVGREYGAWVVPIQVAQENGATVIRDADGRELWRGATDFAKEESASVTLTGGLVAEEEWDGYEGVRDFANVWQNQGIFAKHWQNGMVGRAVPASRTNGLRFTSIEAGTNGSVALSLAWEEDGDADIFVCAVPHDPGVRVFTWTNDENQVVTVTNTVWTMAGPNLSGFDNDWEWRGTATVTNGEGLFVDTGIPDYLGVMRFYAAAEANDTDGDGWNDGWERFVFHTDPTVPNNGNPNPSGTNETTNVFWFVTTTNEYAQRYGRPDCSLNAPAQRVVTIPVSSAAPTTNSIVHDVTVTGFVDDNIKVDGTGVDWRRNVHEFDHRSITNEIADLQSGQFSLELWDWPRADYEGPNEARFGDTNGVPFRVEWTWKVPVEVTGPDFVCVGDTAQMGVSWPDGGPYSWSVEGAAAVIDAGGLLTAVTTGVATVTASNAAGRTVSKDVTVFSVCFEEITPKHGFDNSVNPPWLVVPVHNPPDQNEVRVTVEPATACPLLFFCVEDASKAVPTPTSASGFPQTLVLSGIDKGHTALKVRSHSPTGTVCATLNVCVRDKKTISVDFHFMSDSNGHGTTRLPAEADAFIAAMNAIWTPQANVVFEKGTVDSPMVAADLGSVVEWYPANPANEWDDVVAHRLGGPPDVYFVWEYEQDGTPATDNVDAAQLGGDILFEDAAGNETGETLAHEMGHYLGIVPADYTDKQDELMHAYTDVRDSTITHAQTDQANP